MLILIDAQEHKPEYGVGCLYLPACGRSAYPFQEGGYYLLSAQWVGSPRPSDLLRIWGG